MRRKFTKTKYPGIYAGALPGKSIDRYMVSYRIRGRGQRTKMFLKLAQARKFQGEIQDPGKRQQLRGLEEGKIPLSTYLEIYFDRKRRWAESTRERNRYAAKLILDGRLAKLKIVSITREDVEGWVRDMLEEDVRPGSYEKALTLLRAILREALKEQRVASNAAEGVELPTREHRQAFPLTPEQIALVAETVPARHKVLVYTLGFLGLRIGEASALRVADVDLEKKLLSVTHNSAEVGGRKIDGPMKTERSKRTIPLPEAFVEMLTAHMGAYCMRTESGEADPSAYLFTHEQGGQIRQGNWRTRIFQPACRKAGIVRPKGSQLETPNVHDLRHSAASIAASILKPHEVQSMLGHADSSTTMNIYTHVYGEAQLKAMERIGAKAKEAAGKASGSNVVALRTKEAG